MAQTAAGQPMTFSHPLTRGAKLWAANNHDGSERRMLIIVTTIVLGFHEKCRAKQD